jgi:hypothetical protein
MKTAIHSRVPPIIFNRRERLAKKCMQNRFKSALLETARPRCPRARSEVRAPAHSWSIIMSKAANVHHRNFRALPGEYPAKAFRCPLTARWRPKSFPRKEALKL